MPRGDEHPPYGHILGATFDYVRPVLLNEGNRDIDRCASKAALLDHVTASSREGEMRGKSGYEKMLTLLRSEGIGLAMACLS
jgi:hypothetical protein